MALPAPVAITIMTLIFVGALGYASYSSASRARRIRRVPRSPTNGILGGEVEVEGIAEPFGEMPRMPLSGRPVLHGEWRIERKEQEGKSKRWVTKRSATLAAPFLLRDPAGVVAIDARDHEEPEAMPVVHEVGSSFGRDPSPEMRRFLEEQGEKFEGFLGANHKMRVIERAIEPGAHLYVLGHASARAAGREGARWLIHHTEDVPLFVGTGSEKTHARRFIMRALWFAVAALGSLVVGLVLLLSA